MTPLSDEALTALEQSYDHDIGLAAGAVAEIRHLREQRDRLQTRCSELLLAERAARGVLTLKWKRCGEHALPVPARANAGDAGLDLAVIVDAHTSSAVARSRTLDPVPKLTIYDGSSIVVFRTGWAVEIPPGWYGQIVVRSSIGKAGWDLESSGVVDASFRGEILLPMRYRGEGDYLVEHGQRMTQMVILPVPHVESQEVAELSPSTRGAGAFGSSGK